MSNEKYSYKIVPSVKTSAPVSSEKMEKLMEKAEMSCRWLMRALPKSVYTLGGGPVVAPVITGLLRDRELCFAGIEATVEFELVRELAPVTYKLIAEVVDGEGKIVDVSGDALGNIADALYAFETMRPEFTSQDFLREMHEMNMKLSKPLKLRTIYPAHIIYRVEECK